MAAESGSNVSLTYVPELTRGTTPVTPQMRVLRANSRNINAQKALLTSAELRADRLAGRARHGFRSIVGTVGFELTPEDQDTWIEACLGGTWAVVTGTPTATVTTVQTTRTYTRTTGSFLTDGFLPGDYILIAGFVNAASNGRKTIATVTALALTVVETIGANEAAVAAISFTYIGKRLLTGTTLRTFTIERRFLGVTQFQPFTGVAINNMSLNIQPENTVTGSYDLIGMNFGAFTATSLDVTPTAASTNTAYDGFIGALHENHLLVGLVTGVTLQVNNGRALQPVLFTDGSPDVFDGISEITGTATVLFQDAVMANKFLQETTSSLNLRMDDLAGVEFMRVYIPSVLYTGADMDPPANGPVTLTMPFRANPDSVTGSNLVLQRSNV